MGKKVLVVDDEPVIAEFAADVLGKLPEVTCKKTLLSTDALAMIQAEDFDLIVSDIRMPGLTGIEMLKKMRALGKKTPVIFITGYADNQNLYEAWKNGAYDFIEKPFEPELLVKSAKSALENGLNYIAAMTEKTPETTEVKFNISAEIYKNFQKKCADSKKSENTVIVDLIKQHLLQ